MNRRRTGKVREHHEISKVVTNVILTTRSRCTTMRARAMELGECGRIASLNARARAAGVKERERLAHVHVWTARLLNGRKRSIRGGSSDLPLKIIRKGFGAKHPVRERGSALTFLSTLNCRRGLCLNLGKVHCVRRLSLNNFCLGTSLHSNRAAIKHLRRDCCHLSHGSGSRSVTICPRDMNVNA